MAKREKKEPRLIFLTVILLIVAGLIRLMSYKVGYVLFYLAFLPYLFCRIRFYIKKGRTLTKLDVYRRSILILMVFTIVMNFIGFQNIEFLLILLLGVDYLLLSNFR